MSTKYTQSTAKQTVTIIWRGRGWPECAEKYGDKCFSQLRISDRKFRAAHLPFFYFKAPSSFSSFPIGDHQKNSNKKNPQCPALISVKNTQIWWYMMHDPCNPSLWNLKFLPVVEHSPRGEKQALTEDKDCREDGQRHCVHTPGPVGLLQEGSSVVKKVQSWALSIFLIFSTIDYDIFAFFMKYNLFLHQSHLKSPLAVKLIWYKMQKIIFYCWKNIFFQ